MGLRVSQGQGQTLVATFHEASPDILLLLPPCFRSGNALARTAVHWNFRNFVLLLLLALLHLGQLRELLVKVLILHHLHELLELFLSAGALARTVDHTESTALRFISVLGQRNVHLTLADI